MNRLSFLALGACLLAAPVASIHAKPTNPAAELAGLWSAETRFGPEISGRLLIHEFKRDFRAEIAGFSVPATRTGSELRFALPGNRGSFRGRLDVVRGRLDGHWIQPATPGLSYPSATPVRMSKSGSMWVGEVKPLEDRLRLYLQVIDGGDGRQTTAFVRNPERNVGRFMRIRRVTRDGDRVRLEDENGNAVLEGVLHGEGDNAVLSIHIGYVGRTFDFHRAGDDDATGFYPACYDLPVRKRPPLVLGDGWSTALPRDVGLDPDRLHALVDKIHATRTDGVSTPYIHALLVARRGVLVLEEYFYGYHRNEPHDTRSAGKSLTSMLAGAAMDDDPLFNLDLTLKSIFGDEAAEPVGIDGDPPREQRAAWREELKLRHLLSMSSGLECDDNNSESRGNEDRMQNQSQQTDWVRYGLDLPMARKPGEKAVYCSNSLNLAGASVARFTGRWLPELFAERIAGPLQIERYHFNLDPAGHGYMAGGIRLLPRDQLKLGQVMVSRGMWKKQRVLSEEWVDASLARQAGVNEADDYGFGWWRTSLAANGKEYDVFYASGNGGQLIIGVPELELVVQFSGGNYGDYRTWRSFLYELVPEYILGAVAP